MSKVTRRTFLAGAAGAAGLFAASAKLEGGRAEAKTPAPKFDLERFIDDVKRARTETESQKAVQEVLARAVSEPRGILEELGEPTEDGIYTLHNAKDLTILNIVWAPWMVLRPHNHKMWATIGIYTGREDNILWERTGSQIEATSAASLSEEEVFALSDEAIHSVTNPIDRLTAAIHVYGGDFFGTPRSEWDPETLQERPFDIEGARRIFKEANERAKAGR
jgi:predicted metal-dependent enzyme (double-stranded beta helix superfamily)